MLRSFRVANHKSIRGEQELLLMPAYDRTRPVVPVAAIFGANASGKSNLLDAFSFMQTAVRTSFARWEAGSGVPRKPFKLHPDGAAADSSFVVDLLIEDTQYIYGFAVDDERVNDEWLHAYPKGRKRVIFDREGDKITLGSTISDQRSRTGFLTSLTRPNSLLISVAAQSNIDDVVPVYDWFRTGLRPLDGGARERLRTDPGWVAGIVSSHPGFADLLRVADLGINDLRIDRKALDILSALEAVDEQSLVPFSFPDDADDGRTRETKPTLHGVLAEARRTFGVTAYAELRDQLFDTHKARADLAFLHGEDRVPMTLDEQSEGTVTWLHLLLHAVETLDAGGVMTIDEIDASLHPRLTARLIELFRDEQSNPRTAQLIFTSHDATLLGTSFGQDILDRDQIWFVQKDGKTGASTIYPLSDFHPRVEDNRVRRYLGGSYGGVPAVFSRSLVEILREREDADGAP